MKKFFWWRKHRPRDYENGLWKILVKKLLHPPKGGCSKDSKCQKKAAKGAPIAAHQLKFESQEISIKQVHGMVYIVKKKMNSNISDFQTKWSFNALKSKWEKNYSYKIWKCNGGKNPKSAKRKKNYNKITWLQSI